MILLRANCLQYFFDREFCLFVSALALRQRSRQDTVTSEKEEVGPKKELRGQRLIEEESAMTGSVCRHMYRVKRYSCTYPCDQGYDLLMEVHFVKMYYYKIMNYCSFIF